MLQDQENIYLTIPTEWRAIMVQRDGFLRCNLFNLIQTGNLYSS